MKKCFAAMVLCFTLILLSCVSVTFAAEGKNVVKESVTVTYLEDGYYLVTTLRTYVNQTAPAGAVQQVSGSKTEDLYNSNNVKQVSLTVNGTFSYDGRDSLAMDASYNYDIYNVLWSFSDGSAYWENNTAYATATFKYLGIQSTTLNVSLSCSPDGVLS